LEITLNKSSILEKAIRDLLKKYEKEATISVNEE